MTRQRKEIQKRMDELAAHEQAEHEIGCGFGTEEISEMFAPLWEELTEKMAATYGKTAQEYEDMCYEHQNRLYAAGAIPFC